MNRIVAALAVLTGIVHAAEWPNWRGPDFNGISKEAGWKTQWPNGGPKQLWKAGVGTGFSSFAVADGRAFTVGNASDTDTIYCFDAGTGKELWKFSYSEKLDPKYYEGGPGATPTVDGGRVFMLSKSGRMHCLDAATGKVVWAKHLADELKAEVPRWGFASSALIRGNLCIVNVGSAGAALDKKTGKVVWSSGTSPAGYSTPVPFSAGGEEAALLFLEKHVAAVRVNDGKELWRFPWATTYEVNAADPIVSGQKVFISSGYNRGCALLDASGSEPKPIWENKSLRMQINCAVLLDGHLYGFDDDAGNPKAALRCIELNSGNVKWTENTGFGSLMAADGKLIALTAKGELIVADASPAGFKPISRAQVLGGKCWITPVLANGRIYCRNIAGDVVCLDVRP